MISVLIARTIDRRQPLLETLKNVILDLLEDRDSDRYASYPQLGSEPGDLPIELLADLGYVPVARLDETQSLIAYDNASGRWTAN